jgi:hypothetical protein
MTEFAMWVGGVAVLALIFAVRRAKRRKNVNPSDIYPHW